MSTERVAAPPTSLAQRMRALRWNLIPTAACVFAPVLAVMIAHGYLYSFMCDDAYISFRYARNLIGGHGLVFNHGERVEGYSNLLWILQLAAAWKLGVRPEFASHALSWAYTGATLWLVLAMGLRTRLSAHRLLVAWLATAYLSIDRTFAVWTTGGLETRSFTFFVLLGLYLFTTENPSVTRLAAASIALGAAEYTRPEGSLFLALACAWLLVDECALRSHFDVKRVASGVVPGVLLVAGHFAWRRVYYGDYLPNTYYAKAIPWPGAGLKYWTMATIENGLYVSGPLAAFAMVWRFVRGEKTVALLAACIVSHAAYLGFLGGDLFEYRPMDVYWPIFAVAVAEGTVLLGSAASRLVAMHWSSGKPAAVGFVITTSTVALTTAAYEVAIQVAKHSQLKRLHGNVFVERNGVNWLLDTDATFSTEEARPLYFLPGMHRLASIYAAAESFGGQYCVGVSQEEHRTFTINAARAFKPCEAAIGRGIMPADAVEALPWIGVMSFYVPEATVIDMHGLTDRTIAHSAAPKIHTCMAHEKWPPPGYLKSRGVNFVAAGCTEDAAAALAVGEYAVPAGEGTWFAFYSDDPQWVAKAFPGGLLSRARR
jgi:arabinofuranosyltransferase